MIWRSILFTVFAGVLLASCSSHVDPVPPGYTGPLAVIADSFQKGRNKPTNYQFFEVIKVDGGPILSSSIATKDRGTLVLDPVALARSVPAKRCVLTVRGTDVWRSTGSLEWEGYQAGGNGQMYHLEGDITVDLQPGKEYVVFGVLTHTHSEVAVRSRDGSYRSESITREDKTAIRKSQKRREHSRKLRERAQR